MWHRSVVPVVRRNQIAKKGPAPRRSPCPVACSLDIFGDRWTLLVMRDLFFGCTRFKDFAALPEGIGTKILSERIEGLMARSLLKVILLDDGTKRLAYWLNTNARALSAI